MTMIVHIDTVHDAAWDLTFRCSAIAHIACTANALDLVDDAFRVKLEVLRDATYLKAAASLGTTAGRVMEMYLTAVDSVPVTGRDMTEEETFAFVDEFVDQNFDRIQFDDAAA